MGIVPPRASPAGRHNQDVKSHACGQAQRRGFAPGARVDGVQMRAGLRIAALQLGHIHLTGQFGMGHQRLRLGHLCQRLAHISGQAAARARGTLGQWALAQAQFFLQQVV